MTVAAVRDQDQKIGLSRFLQRGFECFHKGGRKLMNESDRIRQQEITGIAG